MESQDLFSIDLTADELAVLLRGTWEWGGPARATDALTVAMGFRGPDDFEQSLPRLRATLEAGESMSALDWTRLILATEIVFVSDFIGSGWDWSTTAGMSDEASIKVLRGLQLKIRRSGPLNEAINAWLSAQRA